MQLIKLREESRMIFWLDEVRCSGNEASIESCHHIGWGNHDCSMSREGIFLHCSGPGKLFSNITEVLLTRSTC